MKIRPFIRKTAFKLGVCAYRRKSTMEAYRSAAKWISPLAKSIIPDYRNGKTTGLLDNMVIRKMIGDKAVFDLEFNERLNNIRGWIDVVGQRYVECEIDDLPNEKIDRHTGGMVKRLCEFTEMLRRSVS